MGPPLWRKFIKPRMAEMIALAKKKDNRDIPCENILAMLEVIYYQDSEGLL
ncbi:MAG: hypothetical protein KBH15_01380 [Candidatus Atribacteria bacterium]|nr:hypothetical protein [Candidatus Atribacteria bacterium]